ncbi:MAG: hypothetical protein LBN21_13045 [Treponema sp.]|jgi:hypothetical protein|nr:hypothetical protein [Treponema sp.]
MAAGELFELNDIKQCRTELTAEERDNALQNIIRNTRLGIKYFYTLRETCGILRCTYDELMTMLSRYRLDAVLFRSVYRVPWYGLCEYLLDSEGDDLEEALDEYLQAIARRNSRTSKTA